MAERGFNVLIQSCRGTHGGSGGTFSPFVDEEKDGLATLDWIEAQPWYNGKLFTYGPSYVGVTQMALLPVAGNRITGALPMVTTSALNEGFFPGGAFFTALAVQWIRRLVLLEKSAALADFIELIGDRRAQKAMLSVPMTSADKASTGRTIPFYQEWMKAGHSREDPYWKGIREFRGGVGAVEAQVNLYAAWHDLLLPGQIDDYTSMVAAGRTPYLTIGNHVHVDVETLRAGFREGYAWFNAVARGDVTSYRALPVRLYMQGAEEWREYESFPPPFSEDETWYLRPDSVFAPGDFGIGSGRQFRYDPNDPTPDYGGPMLDPRLSGRKVQNEREVRRDVLVYTSGKLTAPIEVIGAVAAELKVRTSGPYFDVFVRLCDVDEEGVSTNVCDGIQRVSAETFAPDEDGVRTVPVKIWPTGYQFAPGHRLRVQVCGGSFPHYARNTGTPDPLGSTTLVPVDIEVLAGSSVTMSVVPSH